MPSIIKLGISNSLIQKGIGSITKEDSTLCVVYKKKSIRFTLYKNDITKTMKIFDKLVGGTMNQPLKEEVWLCISENWLCLIGLEENANREDNHTIKSLAKIKISDEEWL